MSADLYLTGLWFYQGQGWGRAKLRGQGRALAVPPRPVAPLIEEIEYVPEVGVRRLREKFDGWRDMTAGEIRAADRFLAEMFEGES